MNTLKLNLDYKLDYSVQKTVGEVDGVPTQRDYTPEEIETEKALLTMGYIEFAVTSAFKDGLDSQYRRAYSKIQTKVDEAITSKKYEVKLDNGEANFLKKAFSDEKTKFTAKLAKYVVILDDAILAL